MEALPNINEQDLKDWDPNECMDQLSYLAHAYVWASEDPVNSLPSSIAKPWHFIAEKLGRPPILFYSTTVLNNWKLLDPNGPMTLENLTTKHCFHDSQDENWFTRIHIAIELEAAPLVTQLIAAHNQASQGIKGSLVGRLYEVSQSLDKMMDLYDLLYEKVDPHFYFHRVRPYFHGWKNHPLYPDGLLYEDVLPYKGQGQKLRGVSRSQSSILPLVDSILGIKHENTDLYKLAQEMKAYMPPAHRRLLETVEGPSALKSTVIANGDESEILALNACINKIQLLREHHLEFANKYVHQQESKSLSNPRNIGTCGQPFMEDYLKKYKDDCDKSKI